MTFLAGTDATINHLVLIGSKEAARPVVTTLDAEAVAVEVVRLLDIAIA